MGEHSGRVRTVPWGRGGGWACPSSRVCGWSVFSRGGGRLPWERHGRRRPLRPASLVPRWLWGSGRSRAGANLCRPLSAAFPGLPMARAWCGPPPALQVRLSLQAHLPDLLTLVLMSPRCLWFSSSSKSTPHSNQSSLYPVGDISGVQEACDLGSTHVPLTRPGLVPPMEPAGPRE